MKNNKISLNKTWLYLTQLIILCGVMLFSPYSSAKDRIQYHVQNFDGSTLKVINEQGIVTQSYQYAPFGQQLQLKKPSNLKNPNAFVGGVQDAGDLVYLKQRHYNPVLGRFYQPDPITFISGGHGQTNRYQYGWNDTFTFKDPSGLQSTGQWLDEKAMRAASGQPDNTFNWNLYGWSFAAKTWDVFGSENISLWVDGQKSFSFSAGLEFLSAIPAFKWNKLEALSGLKGCCCYVAGTLINTQNGLQPIEEIKIGTLVPTKNLETNQIELKPVSKTFITQGKEIYRLVTQSKDKSLETVEVTNNHPYWVQGQGWVDSAQLKPTMKLLDQKGQVVNVVEVKALGRTENTYNLEVEGNHNYFVGRQQVLVHNCTCGFYPSLYKQMPNVNPNEANRLIEKWDKSTFNTIEDNLAYHLKEHGNGDLAKYLRQADNFNFRGASKRELDNGAIRYMKGNEFIIMRNGKIVTYGKNP